MHAHTCDSVSQSRGRHRPSDYPSLPAQPSDLEEDSGRRAQLASGSGSVPSRKQSRDSEGVNDILTVMGRYNHIPFSLSGNVSEGANCRLHV